MPLLSSQLPSYSGPHRVGVVDIEVPVERRRVADAVFAKSGRPAFEIETVLFSLYYPAAKEAKKSSRPYHKWVSNLRQHAEGYARFAHINNAVTAKIFEWALWALVGSTRVAAEVDIPVYGASKGASDSRTPPPFPVMVFSHGMASSRTSYTHYCGELASRGVIVAVLEHRDGSGPGTEIKHKGVKGSRDVFHIGRSQLHPEPTDDEFKDMQRAMRQAEVEEAVRVLRQINAGEGLAVFESNSRAEGAGLGEFKGRLDEEHFIIGGHSFGATLGLQVLKGSPTDSKRPFIGGILFDPGKQSGPLNDEIDVPVVIVNSQSWSSKFSIFMGRPHFEVVKDIAETVMRRRPKGNTNRSSNVAWFLTSKGTTHPSVTDAPLIEPMLLAWTTGSTIDAREGLLQYVTVSEDFVHFLTEGRRTGVLAEDVTHPEYDNDTRTGERQADMRSREMEKIWQIHVSPPVDVLVSDASRPSSSMLGKDGSL